MNNWKNKVAKAGIAMFIIAALIVSLAVPALAKGGNQSGPGISTVTASSDLNIIKGKVTEINTEDSIFEVQPASGDAVTITVDANTQFYKVNVDATNFPAIREQVKERVQKMQEARGNMKPKGNHSSNERGQGNAGADVENTGDNATDEADVDDAEELPEIEAGLEANSESAQGFFNQFKAFFNRGPKFGQTAAFSDLVVGDGVVLKVMPNENLAKQVMIVKESNLKIVKGEIIDVDDDSFTITDVEGNEVTLNWDENTRISLLGAVSMETGQYARAVYNSDTMITRVINIQLEAPAASDSTVEDESGA